VFKCGSDFLFFTVQQFRRPHIMYEEPHKGMDMMMLGMIGESTQNRDQFITKQVSRHLFSENPPHELGEDLMSLNIQRGRDHGIPGQIYQYGLSVSSFVFVLLWQLIIEQFYSPNKHGRQHTIQIKSNQNNNYIAQTKNARSSIQI